MPTGASNRRTPGQPIMRAMDLVSATEWSEPPPRPRAREDTIDVWRGELGQDRARAMLLDVLGRYTGREPDELRIEQGAGGKPRLVGLREGAPGAGEVRFNLSHSEDVTLVAVCKGREVGIDVESVGRGRAGRIDEVAIARRILGEAAAGRLEAVQESERRVEFLRAWTEYEAMVKCLGIGIGGARTRAQGTELWTAELEVGAGAIAAVAVQGTAGCEVRRWKWSAPAEPSG